MMLPRGETYKTPVASRPKIKVRLKHKGKQVRSLKEFIKLTEEDLKRDPGRR